MAAVYILGAGASAHAGYPIMTQLGPRLADWIIEKSGDAEYKMAIDRLFVAFRADLSNFERIITELEWASPGSAFEAHSEGGRQKLHGTLRRALCDYFDSIRDTPSDLYRHFAEQFVRDGDTILSFNYDLALDRELKKAGRWEAHDGYGFEAFKTTSVPKSRIKLLKLHGSTNWQALMFQGSTGFGTAESSLGLRPVLDPNDWEFFGYPQGSLHGGFSGGVAPRLAVIMPTMNKRFYVETLFGREWERFYDEQWRQARDALRNATRITLIGYSLPVADLRAMTLILCESDRDKEVTLCCGSNNSTLEQKFRDNAFQSIRVVPRFENWLRSS